MAEFDYKEYARQMRENAVKDSNGNIICSAELWEQIAIIIESIGIPKKEVQTMAEVRNEAINEVRKEYIERNHLAEALIHMAKYQFGERQQGILGVVGTIKNWKTADVVEIPESGIGDLSDGYHTFNELYHHRAILFSVICNLFPDKAWKSKLHDTGDMYEGMFIVGIETPKGQATYHYDVDPYWDMFKVKELDKAPKWDGHTPEDAIERISTLSAADVVEIKRGEWNDNLVGFCNVCMECGAIVERTAIKNNSGKLNFCPHCGADMRGETND